LDLLKYSSIAHPVRDVSFPEETVRCSIASKLFCPLRSCCYENGSQGVAPQLKNFDKFPQGCYRGMDFDHLQVDFEVAKEPFGGLEISML